jgi:hypothetical protein
VKKSYSVMALFVLAAGLLGGCSGNPASNSASSSVSPSSSASVSSSPSAAASDSPSRSASSSPSAAPSETPLPSEDPVAPENNPVGDISDSQAFIKYTSKAGGYSLEVPEGWGRTEQSSDVSFIDKLDGVKVAVGSADQAPTVDSVKNNQAADLVKNGRAVKIASISEVTLPQGKAIKITYTSNSEPNSVTGKQVRLDNDAYYYFKNKSLAVLTLWAPLGADNVDQWKRMSESFGWDAP